MAFLDKLGSALLSSINQVGGVSENTPRGLDTSLPFGTGVASFGALGAFSNKIDKSAHRQYLESGMVRNSRPQNLEILMQEPDVTVLIKKRQFSSLIDNYRFDLMNEEERLYVRATKRLFYNKCRAIAAYERLSKIERISANSGVVSDYTLPLIFSSVDVLNQVSPGLIDSKTMSTLNTIKQVKAHSDPSFVTTWITDSTVPYVSEAGEGTGVFELTLVTNLDVTNSVKFMGGSANLSIEDPEKLMMISSSDIEKAIAEASSLFQNQFFIFTEAQLEDAIESLKQALRSLRFGRNVSDIKFTINQDSLLQKKVRAFIDGEARELIFTYEGGFLGAGATIELDQSAQEGEQGLNSAEEDLFKQIIQNIFILLGFRESSKSQIKEFNQQTNYVRQKMYAEFNGYPIIQPMDTVHVFMGSKTKYDTKLSKGLNGYFSAQSVMSKLNNSIGQIDMDLNNLSAAFGGAGGGESYLENEKNAIAGPDFPIWLWYLLRNDFTRQAAGTHIFAGIVESSSHEGAPGRYSLNVSAKDNAHYFSFGQVNIKPSLDVFDSALYDPLTPFKLDFDASSGFVKGEIPPLLDENIKLLNSGSVKLKSGRFRGSKVDQDSYKINDAEIIPSDKVAASLFRRKFNDPDGFVYRWKKGIGSLVMGGQPHSSGFRSESSPTLTNNPFAGQDVMNVLSLLITGQPYNFNNFMRAAVQNATLTRDELFNNSSAASYFRGLLNDLSKNNATWGNFIPFKKLVVNESGYNFLRSGEFDISTSNKIVTDLLRERAKRFDELTSILPQFANNPQFYKIGSNGSIAVDSSTVGAFDLNSIAKLTEDIINLDFQIEQQNKVFQDSLNNSNIRSTDGTLKIFGDDVSFDPTVTDGTGVTPNQKARDRIEFRKRINYLTQRRLWKVKSNTDNNLFIVDDSYDKNYDIQAFERSLATSLQTFKSTYSKVGEQIEGVAQMLGLEIFADSQGHIQARPPQYNRIPSSVFFDFITKKQETGIQIFPSFLESLFINQVQGLTDRIEIIEDEIRLRASALGFVDDQTVETALSGAVPGAGALTDRNFKFVTSTDGRLGGKDLRNLLSQANPDFREEANRRALSELSSAIATPINTGINFDIVQRTTIVNNQSFAGVEAEIENRIDQVRARLEIKTGSPALTRQQLLPRDKSLSGAGRSQLDILELTQNISQFLSERQHLIKLLANAIKNLDQGTSLNRDPDPAQNVLFPYLNKKSNNVFPEIIEHMIEDEDFDDLGELSGKRYVIRPAEIISRRITPTPPPFTIVEVDGALETGLVQGPGGLEIGQGGNGISAAFAADYDMWRQYGFRGYQAVNVPFLSDPQAQCAPYAVFLLNQARKNILKAEVNRVGNEFIQPGEVYYLEDDNLLFYAESVTHSFSYGQQFSTRLNLTYGHSPGEFIPTMLDVIGKGLYSNRYQANLVRHVRNSNPSGDTPITVLVSNNPLGFGNDLERLVQGDYGEQNRKNLGNMMTSTAGLITPTKLGDKINLEIRVYYNSDSGFSEPDQTLVSLAGTVAEWAMNPSVSSNLGGETPSLLPDVNFQSAIPKERIKVVEIDLAKIDEVRSPSSQAWSAARSLISSGNPGIFDNTEEAGQAREDLESANLFTKVIDIWAAFEAPDEIITESSDMTNENLSQDQINRKNEYIEQFNKRLGITNSEENLFSTSE